MTQIIKELIAQSLSFMRARNKTRYVEEFDGNGSAAGDAGAVVGFAARLEVVARTCAVDLQISNCALWVDGCESEGSVCNSEGREWEMELTGSCLWWWRGKYMEG
jgi:hypothetical protein